MAYGPANCRNAATHGNPNDPSGCVIYDIPQDHLYWLWHTYSATPALLQIHDNIFLFCTTYTIIYHQLLPISFGPPLAVSFSRPWKLSTEAHSKRRKSEPGGITLARHSLGSAWIPIGASGNRRVLKRVEIMYWLESSWNKKNEFNNYSLPTN